MTKYREYAINPIDIKTSVALATISGPILAECSLAGTVAKDEDLYDNWVRVWKHNYNLLTTVTRETRKREDLTQSQIHEIQNYLRRMANTMLNARQFAKDVRRGHIPDYK